jgi:glyoxylase I family protein
LINAIHHVCIETNVYEESINFYTKILGFEIREQSADFHGREFNTWIKKNDAVIELQTPKKEKDQEEKNTGTIGLMHVCFTVSDLDAYIQALDSNGFSDYLNGKKKYEVLGKHLSKLKAPEGTIIELRER